MGVGVGQLADLQMPQQHKSSGFRHSHWLPSSQRRLMAHAHGGGAAMPVAGLQPCDRSKITLISTTEPQEGGFGELQNLGLLAAWRDRVIMIFCL